MSNKSVFENYYAFMGSVTKRVLEEYNSLSNKEKCAFLGNVKIRKMGAESICANCSNGNLCNLCNVLYDINQTQLNYEISLVK